MKKVVEGKLYNTKTAEVIHEWSNGYYRNDFHRCEETLYRTRKGAWFLHGEGGALSKYAEPHGSMRGSGEDIVPLTPEEAMRWLEEHDGADAILEHFTDDVEEA